MEKEIEGFKRVYEERSRGMGIGEVREVVGGRFGKEMEIGFDLGNGEDRRVLGRLM